MIHEATVSLRCESTLVGCGIHLSPQIIYIRYPIGATLYNCLAARKGTLEPITIKKYHLVASSKTFGQAAVLYIDTFNWKWPGRFLCRKNTAVALAKAYWEARLRQAVATCD